MSALGLLAAVAPTPTPSPTGVSITPGQGGSPGFLGFVFTFLLAVAAVVLFLSLTKQLRIVDRRAKRRELDDLDAELEQLVDDEAGSRGGEPHLGMIDAGAAGPDLEVDADVPVAPIDIQPHDDAPGESTDEPRPDERT